MKRTERIKVQTETQPVDTQTDRCGKTQGIDNWTRSGVKPRWSGSEHVIHGDVWSMQNRDRSTLGYDTLVTAEQPTIFYQRLKMARGKIRWSK